MRFASRRRRLRPSAGEVVPLGIVPAVDWAGREQLPLPEHIGEERVALRAVAPVRRAHIAGAGSLTHRPKCLSGRCRGRSRGLPPGTRTHLTDLMEGWLVKTGVWRTAEFLRPGDFSQLAALPACQAATKLGLEGLRTGSTRPSIRNCPAFGRGGASSCAIPLPGAQPRRRNGEGTQALGTGAGTTLARGARGDGAPMRQ